MKNQLKTILVLVVTIVLLPQIALASFWNPLSWFKGSNRAQEIIEPTQITPDSRQISAPETVSKKNTEPKNIEVEKPAVKVIEKIITVPDSDLQERVRVLELENQQLRSQLEKLNTLQQQVKLQKEEIESLKNTPVFSKENECEENKEIVSSLVEKSADIAKRKNQEIKDYHTSHEGQPKYQKEIDLISNKYQAEQGKIGREYKSAQTKVQLYCD